MLSVSNAPDNEQRVILAPEEIFFGHPGKEVVAITNQRLCIPELHAGDRWLFYLYESDENKPLLLAYAGGSVPIADAEKDIARLRRLSGMADAGVIRGHIQRVVRKEDGDDYQNVARHTVIAKRKDNGAEYRAVTDNDGQYELEPLPLGSYELSANTTAGWWAEEGTVDVHPRGCQYVGLELVQDSVISGRVSGAEVDAGKPIWVEALRQDQEESHSTYAPDGHFQFHGLAPGRYLIAVEIGADEKHLTYYPGVRRKDLAIVIEIGPGEQHRNIDIPLPAH